MEPIMRKMALVIIVLAGLGAPAIDETPLDASLRTYVDTWQGISLRRIKHFSGYIAIERQQCDPATQECP